MQQDGIRAFTNHDGGRQRTRWFRRVRGSQDCFEDIVRRLVRVPPDVDVFRLDTVSGGGAGPNFRGWIQFLIMDA